MRVKLYAKDMEVGSCLDYEQWFRIGDLYKSLAKCWRKIRENSSTHLTALSFRLVTGNVSEIGRNQLRKPAGNGRRVSNTSCPM